MIAGVAVLLAVASDLAGGKTPASTADEPSTGMEIVVIEPTPSPSDLSVPVSATAPPDSMATPKAPGAPATSAAPSSRPTASPLGPAGGAQKFGARLGTGDCTGELAQQFDYYTSYDLVNLQVIKCVDVTDGNPGNGVPAQVWECNGNGNQKWWH